MYVVYSYLNPMIKGKRNCLRPIGDGCPRLLDHWVILHSKSRLTMVGHLLSYQGLTYWKAASDPATFITRIRKCSTTLGPIWIYLLHGNLLPGVEILSLRTLRTSRGLPSPSHPVRMAAGLCGRVQNPIQPTHQLRIPHARLRQYAQH